MSVSKIIYYGLLKLNREWLIWFSTLLAAGTFPSSAIASMEVEGVQIASDAMVGGKKLTLNGAAARRRGGIKPYVAALYLPERRPTVSAILNLDGARRLQFTILRELTSSTVSRLFVTDFKQYATEDEFKRLITQIGQIGQAYGNIKSLSRGDVVNVDFQPGIGWSASLNDKPLLIEPGVPLSGKEDLMYQIFLRMHIGPEAAEDLRNGLLGSTPQDKK